MKVKNLECPNCGAEVTKGQKKCEYCGSALHFEEIEKQSENESKDFELNLGLNSIRISNKKSEVKISIPACIIAIIFLVGFIIVALSFMIFNIVDMINSPFGAAAQIPFIIVPLLTALVPSVMLVFTIKELKKLIKEKKQKEENKDTDNIK